MKSFKSFISSEEEKIDEANNPNAEEENIKTVKKEDKVIETKPKKLIKLTLMKIKIISMQQPCLKS